METYLSQPSVNMILGMITGAVIMLPVMFLLLCYYVLAPKNIFFTFGRENRAMFVMSGKKFSGRVILPSKTLSVDKENYEIANLTVNSPKQHSILGMYWIGIYPFYSIYERRQQWLEWKSTPTGREIQFRDEITPYLIVKPFEYAMFLKGGEDKNGVPIDLFFTVILKPVHATLPIFGNDNAYGQMQTLCIAEALLFVREKTFSNLGKGNTSSSITKDEFSSVICKLNEKIPGRPDGEGTVDVLGYQIMDAKIDSIEVAGEDKESKKKLLEATTAKYVAEEKGKALKAEAKGKLAATQLEAEGKKALLDVEVEYLESLSGIPGAMKVAERKATPGLTTLVEAGSNKVSLLLGGK